MTVVDHADGHDDSYCGARKRNGNGTCTQAAGWGTDHPGIGCCKLHGGSTPKQIVGAERVRAEREVRAVLAELDVQDVADPISGLLRLAGQVLAWQEATAALVNELDSVRVKTANGVEQLRAEVALYERAMDRAASVLAAIARLNLEERLARVTERQADAVIAAIDAALAVVGVSGERAVEAKQAAARHLRAV
jgi:hypothetical protein